MKIKINEKNITNLNQTDIFDLLTKENTTAKIISIDCENYDHDYFYRFISIFIENHNVNMDISFDIKNINEQMMSYLKIMAETTNKNYFFFSENMVCRFDNDKFLIKYFFDLCSTKFRKLKIYINLLTLDLYDEIVSYRDAFLTPLQNITFIFDGFFILMVEDCLIVKTDKSILSELEAKTFLIKNILN